MNYLIVALGNPGKEYEKTRHNAGWLVIDNAYPDLEWERNSYANAGIAKDGDLLFAKPATFMNASGESVSYLCRKNDIPADHVIVIYDDIDLPLGKVRVSFDRGSGGHNGIKSIQEHLGTQEFLRIRIGVSKILESGDIAKPNVLGTFEAGELQILKELSKKVRDTIGVTIKEGKEKAMTMFNQ